MTFFFLLVGGITIAFSIDRAIESDKCYFAQTAYLKGEIIPGYKEDYVCSCEGAEVVCTKIENKLVGVPVSEFGKKDLSFNIKYVAEGENSSLNNQLLKTKISNVNLSGNNLEVVIEQIQLCSADQRAPVQIGLYHFENDALLLTHVINRSPSLYKSPCVVSLTYKIKSLDISNVNNLKIGYMSSEGEILPAILCYYNSKVYAQDDVYMSFDNCNICRCENGISKCTNDRVCSDKESN